MSALLNTAVSAAYAAGEIILRNIQRLDSIKISEKGKNEFVSEVDQKAEEKILSIISKKYPNDSVLAEESGLSKASSDNQWLIDPLDGTTNYIHSFPHYAVSIALQKDKELILGVVYDPFKQELFTAEKGQGALLNNHKIRVSQRTNIEGALLGTGIPFREGQDVEQYMETLRSFIKESAGIRRAGAAALDLAYVASARLDGFWETKLNPWDIAAGIVIVRESGGLITDLEGGENYFDTGNIVAANVKILKSMLKHLRKKTT
ncbi:MAG: inositol monophosphatase family protein [Pseudomonadota bacterium]